MKDDILEIYTKFEETNLNLFFDYLISFVKKYSNVFEKYTSTTYLEAIQNVSSNSYILGHSDDNFNIAIPFYIKQINEGLSEEGISNQISTLIWDLSAYMTNEECPSCHDSNLRLTITNENNQVIKFCDECLYTGLDGRHIDIEGDLIPAPKEIVEKYLNDIK